MHKMNETSQRPIGEVDLSESTTRDRAGRLPVSETLVEAYMQDKAQVFELLQRFRGWFSLRGQAIQCTLFQLGKTFGPEYAFDILKDCGSALNDVEHHVLYTIITHFGDRTFSFSNILDLVESIKGGHVQTCDLSVGLIQSPYITVTLYTINGSIPYNPLNMQFSLTRDSTIRQVIHHVKSEFDWPSRNIKVYQSAECEEALEDDIKLTDLVDGRPVEQSYSIELYMDYSIGYIDNPLILCDYYFEDRTVDNVLKNL